MKKIEETVTEMEAQEEAIKQAGSKSKKPSKTVQKIKGFYEFIFHVS